MKYYVDTADLATVKEAFNYFPLNGVTMNPTIAMMDLKGKNIDFFEHAKEVRSLIGEEREFHIQVVGEQASEMIKDGERLSQEISGNLFVKIPACSEGYKAMRTLTEKGIQVTATAIIDLNQAMMSAASGAKYVAPYVNRISNIASDGDKVLKNIVTALQLSEYDTRVVGASFKNALQVEKSAIAGAYGAALGYDVLKACGDHLLTEKSIKQFTLDWEATFGEGSLIYNL
ncbi:transaldolase family protein [Candidatus Enterococcus ferrettii]|uniref:Fructose-6-phosphate aldolase n=1 Tax=Candidatus Enterococcus ferrettii TaxID=2815324 RepID=A0ABV0EU93_9ENTE|nr:transaldolase family protein [Enterococcus sp. 665A]MBO1339489.1 hypothetical protein [Enterococcus sp. 665A]